MAKITITIEDVEDGRTDATLTSDPPMKKDVPFTMAQTAGARAMVFARALIEGAIPVDEKGRPKILMKKPEIVRKKL